MRDREVTPLFSPQRLCIDVTRTLDSGLHTGIQRVVRGLLRGALQLAKSRPDLSVHAVRCEGECWIDVGDLPPHALEVAQGGASSQVHGEVLQPRPGDRLLLADASWYLDPWPAVDAWISGGGRVDGFVHDLLPMQRPQWFRAGTSRRYLAHFEHLLAHSDLLFVGSRHVAKQLAVHVKEHGRIQVLPPASSFVRSASSGPPRTREHRGQPFFLCVATLEPRKNHHSILNAFQAYWAKGGDAALVLVGKEGWRTRGLMERIAQLGKRDRRLRWLKDVDDAQLESLYRQARALVYVPEDEGFGLPVLEARELACPVIASDIPPLHEAGASWPRFVPRGDDLALVRALDAARTTRGGHEEQGGRRWIDVARELVDSAIRVEASPPQRTGTEA